MRTSDFFNTTLLEANEGIDEINKRFYGRYNYPWPPMLFQGYPPAIAPRFLNQDIGCYDHSRIAANPKIWVAGCGTNQAIFTALRFPDSQVLATDISTQSLAQCKKNAEQIGIRNLQLEEISINHVDYAEAFDYIICTGVVHHNANPGLTLGNIARALKKNGVFEFMVYNYYHRLLSTAYQKAVRTFYNSGDALDLDLELDLTRRMIRDFEYNNLMGDFLKSHATMHEAEVADRLVQPVEYSYTIESLGNLLRDNHLQYLHHVQNQFDVKSNAFTWNVRFGSPHLKALYESLPDEKRWQIGNLLLSSDSPMLWFYVQREDADSPRKSEQTVCEAFLATRFRKSDFALVNYVLDPEGTYKKRKNPLPYPSEHDIDDPLVKQVFRAVQPNLTIKEIFLSLGIEPDFYTVNKVRIKLTTSGYPYLLAV